MDAETLAVRLHRHAQEGAARIGALRQELEREEAATVLLERELGSMEDEAANYSRWLGQDAAGGEAFRMSKALVEERDRRVLLEQECAALRSKLTAVSTMVRKLTEQREEAQRREQETGLEASTTQALEHLARLRT